MGKTDKELTTEITIAFIESWNNKSNTAALKIENVCDIIEAIYRTVNNLPGPETRNTSD